MIETNIRPDREATKPYALHISGLRKGYHTLNQESIYTLVASNNTYGRYALDEPNGPELSSGQPLSIRLNGQWIAGSIEHALDIAVNCGMSTLFDNPGERTIDSYYFIGSEGGICGLCVGMEVKLG